LQESKRRVLEEYNLFNYVADVCRRLPVDESVGSTTVRPASKFFSAHNLYLYTVGRNYYKLKNRWGL